MLPYRLGKLPDEPDVGEILQPPHRFRCPIVRGEDDLRGQLLHQAALPGNAELGGEVAVNVGDDVHGQLLHGVPPGK